MERYIQQYEQQPEFIPGGYVRKANEADIGAIFQLLESEAQYQTVLARPLHEIHDRIDSFYVLDTGQISGCASLDIYDREIAEIRSVAVARNTHNGGAGKALIRACIHDAKQQQIRETFVTTNIPSYFMKLGFQYEKGGRRVLWRQKEPQSAIMHHEVYPHIVEKASTSDIDAIVSLIQSEARHRTIQNRTREVIDHNIDSFLVVRQDGNVAACLSIKLYSPRIGELRSLVVSDEYRHQGIGSQIIEAGHQAITVSGVREVFVTASEGKQQYFLTRGFGTDPTGKSILWLQ